MGLTRDFTGLLTVVNLCGSESAQVVAAHVARLVQRIAPDFRLRIANRVTDMASGAGDATNGYIFLLPTDGADVSPEWQRLRRDAESDIPALPLRIGESHASTIPQGEEAGALPELHISSWDARIEHGGQLFLEQDIAGALKQRLGDLLEASRRSAIRFASSHPTCPLPTA